MSFSILTTILFVFASAVLVTVIFKQLRLPIILGYLVVGVLVGPNGLGWIPDLKDIRDIAEFGVVLLMFAIGLEFSLPRLLSLKRHMFLFGSLQVVISLFITLGVGMLLGMAFSESLVIGGVVAMSSTAIVIKQLTDQSEINDPHGLNALGILLFQDLAVIPFFIIITSLANIGGIGPVLTLTWALANSIVAIVAIFAIGRLLLKPLFRLIAQAGSLELFTMTVLLVTLAASWLTENLGLSLAFGAFLAGMMLGETEFRHQIAAEIRPFRDILMGLFFISIGMLLNVSSLQQTWMWVLLLLAALVLFKSLLIMILARILGSNKVEAFRTGLVLGQGSEFGFAILTLALSYKLLPSDYGQVILGALVLSMTLAPLIIHYNLQMAKLLFPKRLRVTQKQARREITRAARPLTNHVIICGYGRVGQNIARLLEQEEIAYLALDLDHTRVANASLAGDTVNYGDATNLQILLAARLLDAKALVISFNNTVAAFKILDQVRSINVKIPIIVRSENDAELESFRQHGATKVIPETFEGSLMLAYQLLLLMHVSPRKIAHLIHEVRGRHYELLRRIFPGETLEEMTTEPSLLEALQPVLLTESSAATGKYLRELNLEDTGAKIVVIRRQGEKKLSPSPNTKLQVDDIVVLFGAASAIEQAEKRLLG